jgi:Xaa-Pro aminopeptidase
MYEYEIEALVAYGFRRYHGTEAFPTIVASGPNACILHYTKNTRPVEEGDMVLLDFGIEIDGYGADISRTFPVGGPFSPRQRELYDAVLEVQQFAASILRPGMTRRDWNIQVKEYMYDTCQSLGLKYIADSTPETNPYFPHSIGHFLGLDTHDVGDADMPLEPGMILTIEPGIYIQEESIGIRIEDDYLVTEMGCERL